MKNKARSNYYQIMGEYYAQLKAEAKRTNKAIWIGVDKKEDAKRLEAFMKSKRML